MGEAPAFQFYARDFLVSTTRMTTAQVGLYMRALSNQWDSGPLPADEQELARTLISPLAEFRKLWPVVSKKFILTDAGYINQRLEREREKQEAFRLKLSEKGKRGAGKRWQGHSPANATGMPQPSSSQCPDDASSSAVCDLQSATAEKRETAVPAFAPAGLMHAWNETTTPPIARCREINKARAAHARARILERPSLVEWTEILRRIEASPFCRGQNDRGWVASFDWLLQPDTPTKVLEGKYDYRPSVVSTKSSRTLEAGKALDAKLADGAEIDPFGTIAAARQLAEKASA